MSEGVTPDSRWQLRRGCDRATRGGAVVREEAGPPRADEGGGGDDGAAYVNNVSSNDT